MLRGVMPWTTVHLVATIVVGAAFLISGISKVRTIEDTRETLAALGLPSWLQRRWVAGSYPLGEIALGVGLLVLPAPVWWVWALAGVVLMAVLTALVVRVVRSGQAVSCNCFGSAQVIDSRTIVRNGLLTLLALVTVIADPRTSAPVADALMTQPDLLFAVVLAASTAAIVTFVVLRGPARPHDVETYEDRPLTIPDVTVRDASGSMVPIPRLTADGAVLLINVKTGCSPCSTVIDAFADGSLIAGRVRVRLMERTPADGSLSPDRLWDDDGQTARVLSLASTPSALLLAADGTIPADPVRGSEQIFDLVRGIEEAVASMPSRALDDVDL
jgi:hypothetical protein